MRRWEGPQYRKLSAEMLQESQTSCAHVHCFFERAKASDRPFKESSESSFMFHNEAISLLSNLHQSNSSLLCSLQPCLLCALCLRFALR